MLAEDITTTMDTGVTALVPFRTQYVPNGVETYVSQYRSYQKKAAESVILMASTFVEAKADLSAKDFEQFCDTIDVNPKSSTFRKHMIIGEAAHRLEAHMDLLPDAWTTIYEVAALTSDQFRELVDSKTLKPTMTAKDLKAFLGQDNSKALPELITLNVTSLDDGKLWLLNDELFKLKDTYGFEIRFSAKTDNRLTGGDQYDQ